MLFLERFDLTVLDHKFKRLIGELESAEHEPFHLDQRMQGLAGK